MVIPLNTINNGTSQNAPLVLEVAAFGSNVERLWIFLFPFVFAFRCILHLLRLVDTKR